MSGLSEKEERDAVDNVTNAMFSGGFLDSISLLVNTPRGHDLSVGDFYEQWLAGASPKQRKLPISPGIIVGLLYLALVYGKELWFDQLPDVPVCQAEEAWGITRAMYSCPKESRPSLRYVVRRLRNAMAHGNVTVHVLPAPPSTGAP